MHIREPGWKNTASDNTNVSDTHLHVPPEPKIKEWVVHHRKRRCYCKSSGHRAGKNNRSLRESTFAFIGKINMQCIIPPVILFDKDINN